jgi:BirA family biotin operon repressor/biotin-[acetyl-CoA-carboxylase] ligase
LRDLTGEAILSLGSPLARIVEVHGALASTQDRARELAQAGSPHGTLVVAKALRELGTNVGIKWPNDLLAEPGGRKICGILAEASIGAGPGRASRLDYALLGVGLNANLDPEDLGVTDREVATLRSELGRDAEPLDLLRRLLGNLDAELGRIHDFASVLDDWRALSLTLGQDVRVRRSGEVLEGRALDIGPGGALLLQSDGYLVELHEGEVEQVRQDVGGRPV